MENNEMKAILKYLFLTGENTDKVASKFSVSNSLVNRYLDSFNKLDNKEQKEFLSSISVESKKEYSMEELSDISKMILKGKSIKEISDELNLSFIEVIKCIKIEVSKMNPTLAVVLATKLEDAINKSVLVEPELKIPRKGK